MQCVPEGFSAARIIREFNREIVNIQVRKDNSSNNTFNIHRFTGSQLFKKNKQFIYEYILNCVTLTILRFNLVK